MSQGFVRGDQAMRLSDAEFAKIQQHQKALAHEHMQESNREGAEAEEALCTLRGAFKEKCGDMVDVSSEYLIEVATVCCPVWHDELASKQDSLRAYFRAEIQKDGRSSMSFDDFAVYLLQPQHSHYVTLHIPVKAAMLALLKGKKSLVRRRGKLCTANYMMDHETVTMTLRDAFAYCYEHDECQAFSIQTASLQKPESATVKVFRGKFDYISASSHRENTGEFTTFVKVPNPVEPVGVTYRLHNKNAGAPRSTFLCHLLTARGYTRVTDPKVAANFMFFSHPTWYKSDPGIRLSHFETYTMNQIDDKRLVWEYLVKAGKQHWMPWTYLDLSDFREKESGFETSSGETRLYFIKDKLGVHQNGVWCCNGVADVETKLKELSDEKSKPVEKLMKETLCIQTGVQKLLTLEGKKYNMRVYVVVLRDADKGLKVYMFESIHMRVFNLPHDEQSTDPNIQIGMDGHTYQTMATELKGWHDVILPQLRKAAGDVARSFPWDLRYPEAGQEGPLPSAAVAKVALLGFDFLIDSEMKPWVIEVNGWPCVEWRDVEGRGSLTSQFKLLLADFYSLIIAPAFEGVEPTSVHLKEV